MQEIVEGFAVATSDDLIFTVKGLLHPSDRVIAYLRYLPDPQGERQRGGVRYRRVYGFEAQRQILARYGDYLTHDATFGIRVQGVPRRLIRTVHDPCRHLAARREKGPGDPVEEQGLELAETLREAAGVPLGSLGISGSVLVGLHQPNSDIDLIVYGEAAGHAVHRALRCLVDDPAGSLRRPNQEDLARLHAAHCLETPLPFADFVRLQARKVNELRFRGREVFIRFVKWPAEAGERYGDRCFEPLGSATIRARVADDRDAMFTPARYGVEDVAYLEGGPVAAVRELISFRGRFSEQARVGECAVARGSLERVVSHDHPPYHRVVVGGRVGDYLLAEPR